MLRRKAIELLMFAVKSPKTSHYRQLLLISEDNYYLQTRLQQRLTYSPFNRKICLIPHQQFHSPLLRIDQKTTREGEILEYTYVQKEKQEVTMANI